MEEEGMEKFLAPCPRNKMRSGGAAHRLRASVVLRQSSDEVKGLQWSIEAPSWHAQVSLGEVA